MDNSKVALIIRTIDEHIEKYGKNFLTAVEAGEILDRQGILKDSLTRRGKPLRNLLNAEKIPHAYQVGVFWKIPHSKEGIEKTLKSIDLPIEEPNNLPNNSISEGHKLEQIALLISQILKEEKKVEANYSIEHSPSWLTAVPIKEELVSYWELIQEVYSSLVDCKYDLDNQIKLITRFGNQHFDIWFHEPYSFAVEFDESQHFNQFRLRSLKFYSRFKCAFDITAYKSYSDSIKKPGKSGFQKLKSKDPLFPEMYDGDKQDNRIRQRAFRDFLKDIIPIAKGFNPTLRIPYQIVNKKIGEFNKSDLNLIKTYIIENELVTRISVRK